MFGELGITKWEDLGTPDEVAEAIRARYEKT